MDVIFRVCVFIVRQKIARLRDRREYRVPQPGGTRPFSFMRMRVQRQTFEGQNVRDRRGIFLLLNVAPARDFVQLIPA